ncbi:MAG: CopD family protein [Flavobacteriaceae bacterium]
MNLHHILLIIHLICAAVWVGGHLFLVIRVLPKALREKDVLGLRNFKDKYEPLGMPCLLLLVITGIWMAYDYNVKLSSWFSFSNAIERVVSIKLILLLTTAVLAVLADRVIFPRLTPNTIKRAALPMILVTLISVAMLVLGSFVRYGGIH